MSGGGYIARLLTGAGVAILIYGPPPPSPAPIGVDFSSRDTANTLRKFDAIPRTVLDEACKAAVTRWTKTGSTKPLVIDLSSGRATLPPPAPGG
jgi:hypothetical protein